MKIQVGEVLMDSLTHEKRMAVNKTRKYLLPILKKYGKDFTSKIENVFKVAAGIGDFVSDNCGFTHEKHVFILIDTVTASAFFIKFIEWIRDSPVYEDDYVFGDIQKSTFHMVVIKFPEEHWESLEKFKLGEYSKMYDGTTINDFFTNNPDARGVLLKEHNYRIKFTAKLNRKYGTNIQPEDVTGEYDFPPTDESDKFNHHLKKKKS